MVVINKKEVLDIYLSILNKNMSYDCANKWALEMMKLEDDGKLIYEPKEDEEIIWELISYLYGINMPSILDRSKPSRNDKDIILFLKELNIKLG